MNRQRLLLALILLGVTDYVFRLPRSLNKSPLSRRRWNSD